MNMNIRYDKEDEQYIDMIYKIAHSYPENTRCAFDDYVNVGLAALHKARQLYDADNPGKVKFITYAYNVIQKDILKEWQNNTNELSCSSYHVVNTPNAKEEVQHQNKTSVSINNHNKDGQTFEGVISASGGSLNKRMKLMDASGSFSPQRYAEQCEISDKVNDILSDLDPQDRDILIKRIYQGETFEYISNQHDISWRTLNYKFHKIVNSLKRKFIEEGLDEYAVRD